MTTPSMSLLALKRSLMPRNHRRKSPSENSGKASRAGILKDMVVVGRELVDVLSEYCVCSFGVLDVEADEEVGVVVGIFTLVLGVNR